RFLLAVSGGCDSVALAHLFASCRLNFDIAHCNFHLRGEESNKEMFFVENLPFLTGQQVFVKEFNTLDLQQASGKSIEMVARELRYQWFEEIGNTYHYIVTAHHANDNVETLIMNLLRRTGLRGMCGIPPKNGKLIRPLLRFRRSEIESYCLEQGVGFCVDSSNLEDSFLRNRVRHHIIPELEKVNSNCVDVFYKNATLFQQQTQFFDTQIQQYRNQLFQQKGNRIFIEIEALKQIENIPLILYELLTPFGFNADEVDSILKASNSGSGKRFISNTHILIKDRRHFFIEAKEENNVTPILIRTVDDLKKHGFTVEKMNNNTNIEFVKSPNVIYVDADKLTFPLQLRGWQKGDSFHPFGMQTKKKLSDFFTDMKINILEKQKIRILSTETQIVWIVNYRADDRFRIDANTKSYYCFSVDISTN
ncbi:MAG: tRNA lysidine(34) synthetase TilS, partial [Lentimicrobiaceae bacterium]|nr:tRNA lysidine(34) synthetase TilS [Lentimicrobiaceae bacterium]